MSFKLNLQKYEQIRKLFLIKNMLPGTGKYISAKAHKYINLLARVRNISGVPKDKLIAMVFTGACFAWSLFYYAPSFTIKTNPESHVEQPAGSPPVQNAAGDRHLDPSVSRQETASHKEVVMIATAYDSSWESCGPWDGKTTASGLPVRRGIVAVDPDVIPLGTRLYVEGYGAALAADTGGAIKGNRIDLYMESREEALNYGIRTIKVRILN